MNDYHKRCAITGRFVRKHPPEQDALYRIWCAMKERCQNPNNKRYSRYGGRGISVCEEWKNDFSVFAKWAEDNGYHKGLTIERKNFNGNYEPENCKWATRKEQNRNYSRNRMITYNGKTQCIADWADEIGMNAQTISFRLRSGHSVEESLENVDRRTTRHGRK